MARFIGGKPEQEIVFSRCKSPRDMGVLSFLNQKLFTFFTDSGFPSCSVRKEVSEPFDDLE